MTNKIKPKEQKIIKKAQDFLARNDAQSANNALLQYTKTNKVSAHTKYLLALSHAVLGNHTAALPIANEINREIPNNNDILKLLGGIHHELRNYDNAITAFEKALSISANDFQTLANIASSLKERKDYSESDEYYKKSLMLQQNQPDTLTNYGLLKQINGHYDEAISLHRQCLVISPGHIAATYNLAYALNEIGNTDESLNHYNQVLKYHPNHIRALCDIAHIHEKLQEPENAIELLQKALVIDNNDEYVHLNLGICHKMLGNAESSIGSFRKTLEINSDNTTAKYYLAILTDSDIKSSPDDYVTELFDGYAETFDHHLINKLQYKTPELIGRMVTDNIDSKLKHNILDLGCGTGLAGIYLKDLAGQMIGVDLSPKMLNKARQRDIYNELVASGIEQYFEADNKKFDIIVAADVFVYIGDLSNIFKHVSNALNHNGLFVFSTEDTIDFDDYKLVDSGRFKHNKHYINSLAKSNNLEIISTEKTDIRYEMNEPITGQIYLISKMNNQSING